MRNLNGFFNKILLIFSLLLFFFPFKHIVLAADDLTVQSSFHHDWDGQIVDTTIYLTLSTQSSSTVVTYYTVTIPETSISPEVYSISRDTKLEPTIHKGEYGTDLVIDLENSPIYPEKPIILKITYSKPLSGDSISLVSNIRNTQTDEFVFTYPSSLGQISWSSATILSIDGKGNNLEITTEIPNTDTVKITFGSRVIYHYTIKKTLSNPGTEIIISEVTLPINNSQQRVTISDITPLPDKAYKDLDGNYILQYGIAPQSIVDVNIEGNILMDPHPYPYPLNPEYENTSLWKISNTSLIRHTNRYIKEYGLDIPETFNDIDTLETIEQKELLYESLYKYVIENLVPNTTSIGSLSGTDRLGGEEILLKQDISTSEDYIDSIISLYRYYNIPARFVIGYLSNISNYDSNGIFHYWGEYFNSDTNDWIPIEPFFEDFSRTPLWKKDMKDHIALIIRYRNPYTPKLPFYTQDEFNVELVKEDIEYRNSFKLDILFSPYKLSEPYLTGYITIENTGNTILDTFNISSSKPDLTKYIDYIENNSNIILLPNQSYDIKFNIPYDDIEDSMFVVMNAVAGTDEIKDIYIEKEVGLIHTLRELNIFSKLLSVLIYITFLLGIYFFSKKVKSKKNG